VTVTHLIRWLLAVAGILFLLAPAQSQEPGVRISPLYHFGTRANDPIWPQEIGSIAVGPDGSLYTTSTSGGARNLGTIYKVSPSGDLTVLWEFDGLQTGAGPQGGLTDGRDGYFYGTTYTGGKFSSGTLFRLAYGGTKPEILYHFRNGSVFGLQPPPCPTQPYIRSRMRSAYDRS
jgi:uncharacterized repeat protein (TIGR03803 family)